MWVVRGAASEWWWVLRLLCRGALLVAVAMASSVADAQAAGVGLGTVVCGPEGVSGVVYVMAAGSPVGCGFDAAGNALALQLDTQLFAVASNGQPSGDGAAVGADIGAAVLLVLAAAFGFRVLRNFINSSPEV